MVNKDKNTENIKIIKNIEVMYVEAKEGVSGSKKAFDDLESRLPGLRGQKILWCRTKRNLQGMRRDRSGR